MATRRTYRGLTSDERHAERRARLVTAGREIAGSAGYGAMSIEATCRAAGVTARHFYDHFTGREALMVAVYESVLDDHRGAVAAALADAPADGLEPRVRTAIGAALGAWLSDPAAARIAFLEVVGTSELVEARRQQGVQEYVELVLAMVEDLRAGGLAERPGDPVRARAVVAAVIGLVELWLSSGDPPPIEHLVDVGTEIAVATLR